MNTSIDVLNSYANAFRRLVNEKVSSRSPNPGAGRSIKQSLKLNKQSDWDFLSTSMDIVGDASNAIRNFLKFGLDGPTRYNDVGERYLRLYGVLTATYIQQQAVLKLYKLMNVPKPKDIKKKLDALEIRTLRHKLASHGTDYQEVTDENIETFIPIQITVRGFDCCYFDNLKNTEHHIDLEKEIEKHCRLLTSVLDSVYAKAVQSWYKNQMSKIAELNQNLEELRIQGSGSLVIRMTNLPHAVIQTMGRMETVSDSTEKPRNTRPKARSRSARKRTSVVVDSTSS